jgi:hypothetical protein
MVLPIENQTVLSSLGNVGKLQHQQQMASLELQAEQNLKDARELKQKDDQIENTKNIEENKVTDALNKGEDRSKSGTPPKHEEEKKEDEAAPGEAKGKIIDTVG